MTVEVRFSEYPGVTLLLVGTTAVLPHQPCWLQEVMFQGCLCSKAERAAGGQYYELVSISLERISNVLISCISSFLLLWTNTKPQSSFIEEIVYPAFGFQGESHLGWQVWQQLARVRRRERTSSLADESRENGPEVGWEYPKWCDSPSKPLCPKSSVTSPNSNTSRSPSVQTWADGDISHSNHRSRSLAIYVGHSMNGLSKMNFTHWEERPIGIYNIWVHSEHIRRQRDSGFPLPCSSTATFPLHCVAKEMAENLLEEGYMTISKQVLSQRTPQP